MAKLFGIDIAKEVNRGIASAGGVLPGVLTVSTSGTRTPGDLTGGTNPSSVTKAFRGFVETEGDRRPGSTVAGSMAVVTILGASVQDGVVPEVNMEVNIEGTDYSLVELLSRDPAQAVYRFRGEAV